MEKYKLLLNGKEISQPDNGNICFENPSRKEKSEKSVFPGKIIETEDRHVLAFCFDRGGVVYLHFNEALSEETVKEFIEKAKFFEYSYHG